MFTKSNNGDWNITIIVGIIRKICRHFYQMFECLSKIFKYYPHSMIISFLFSVSVIHQYMKLFHFWNTDFENRFSAKKIIPIFTLTFSHMTLITTKREIKFPYEEYFFVCIINRIDIFMLTKEFPFNSYRISHPSEIKRKYRYPFKIN